MASFPALKTGALAQYPSDRRLRFSTLQFHFMDGSEQRFPAFGTPLRRWVIRLELLDEGELALLEAFFLEQGGRAGSFSLPDPWDGVVHANCSFESDALTAEYQEAGDGRALIVVKENR